MSPANLLFLHHFVAFAAFLASDDCVENASD
jgi:hypothetical protein